MYRIPSSVFHLFSAHGSAAFPQIHFTEEVIQPVNMVRGAKNVLQTWWTNVSKPNFRETAEDAPGLPLSNYTTAERQTPPTGSRRDKRVPSSHLTLHQFLYIAGSHGIGALIISGGINFALAYG